MTVSIVSALTSMMADLFREQPKAWTEPTFSDRFQDALTQKGMSKHIAALEKMETSTIEYEGFRLFVVEGYTRTLLDFIRTIHQETALEKTFQNRLSTLCSLANFLSRLENLVWMRQDEFQQNIREYIEGIETALSFYQLVKSHPDFDQLGTELFEAFLSKDSSSTDALITKYQASLVKHLIKDAHQVFIASTMPSKPEKSFQFILTLGSLTACPELCVACVIARQGLEIIQRSNDVNSNLMTSCLPIGRCIKAIIEQIESEPPLSVWKLIQPIVDVLHKIKDKITKLRPQGSVLERKIVETMLKSFELIDVIGNAVPEMYQRAVESSSHSGVNTSAFQNVDVFSKEIARRCPASSHKAQNCDAKSVIEILNNYESILGFTRAHYLAMYAQKQLQVKLPNEMRFDEVMEFSAHLNLINQLIGFIEFDTSVSNEVVMKAIEVSEKQIDFYKNKKGWIQEVFKKLNQAFNMQFEGLKTLWEEAINQNGSLRIVASTCDRLAFSVLSYGAEKRITLSLSFKQIKSLSDSLSEKLSIGVEAERLGLGSFKVLCEVEVESYRNVALSIDIVATDKLKFLELGCRPTLKFTLQAQFTIATKEEEKKTQDEKPIVFHRWTQLGTCTSTFNDAVSKQKPRFGLEDTIVSNAWQESHEIEDTTLNEDCLTATNKMNTLIQQRYQAATTALFSQRSPLNVKLEIHLEQIEALNLLMREYAALINVSDPKLYQILNRTAIKNYLQNSLKKPDKITSMFSALQDGYSAFLHKAGSSSTTWKHPIMRRLRWSMLRLSIAYASKIQTQQPQLQGHAIADLQQTQQKTLTVAKIVKEKPIMPLPNEAEVKLQRELREAGLQIHELQATNAFLKERLSRVEKIDEDDYGVTTRIIGLLNDVLEETWLDQKSDSKEKSSMVVEEPEKDESEWIKLDQADVQAESKANELVIEMQET